jgi:hypothetical protein
MLAARLERALIAEKNLRVEIATMRSKAADYFWAISEPV